MPATCITRPPPRAVARGGPCIARLTAEWGPPCHSRACSCWGWRLWGIYTLHLKSLDWRGLCAPLWALRRERASQLALLVGVTIASYSVVDKVGVRYVRPFPYLYLVFAVTGVALAPYMLTARRAAIQREWQADKMASVAAGRLHAGSFLLVLIALTSSKV